jgi:predicted ArsR family transcriptional regulator
METVSGPEPAALARPDGVERLIAAMQDGTRRAMLLALVEDGRPRTVDELAALAGVHRTVAFTHAERLVDLGYLEKTSRRGRVGKPAAVYTFRRAPIGFSCPDRQFELLAGLLAEGLGASGRKGLARAREAGRRFGRAQARPGSSGAARALAGLEPLGARYRVDGDRVVAGNCVFLEACSRAPAVVCSLHAGILEGALEGSGVAARVEPRGPVDTRACAFSLAPG